MPPEPADLTDRTLRDRAVAAARGDTAFDTLITNGNVFDSITGEVRPADVGLIGPLIASVHPAGSRSESRDMIDADGGVVSPGLIDTHMHVESSMVTPATYANAVLPRGVTTVVWDPHELANVHGVEGVDWAIKATQPLPMRFAMLAPSCVPSAPGFEFSGADFAGVEMQRLLARPEIGGVAEVMNMAGVVNRRQRMSDIVQAGIEAGKPVCGHARGLGGSALNAYLAAGVSSDHELISAKDFLEKLHAGMIIELRGSHDHLLPEIVAALNSIGHLPPTVTICTDDIFPDDLDRDGGLDDVLRRLIGYGMPPQWALRSATYNAAIRLGRSDLGLVAAGRRADLAIFDNLEGLNAGTVIANGLLVAHDRKLVEVQTITGTKPLQNSVHCPVFFADDFRIRSDGRRVRVATIDRPRFTRWAETETAVEDGYVVPPKGATLIGVCHRHGRRDARMTVGFLTGWGTWDGAFCTTVSHDSHNLTVFGGNEADMALAANTVSTMGGGLAVVRQGEILACLALPLSGLISDAPLNQVADDFAAIRSAMDRIVDWQPPYLVFKACFGATLACNAGPHQTDLGLADVSRGEPLSSPVLEVLQ